MASLATERQHRVLLEKRGAQLGRNARGVEQRRYGIAVDRRLARRHRGFSGLRDAESLGVPGRAGAPLGAARAASMSNGGCLRISGGSSLSWRSMLSRRSSTSSFELTTCGVRNRNSSLLEVVWCVVPNNAPRNGMLTSKGIPLRVHSV